MKHQDHHKMPSEKEPNSTILPLKRTPHRYTPQNKHGTWKWTLGKGDSYWKPSFPGSMLIFGGVSKKPQNLPLGLQQAANKCPSHLVKDRGLETFFFLGFAWPGKWKNHGANFCCLVVVVCCVILFVQKKEKSMDAQKSCNCWKETKTFQTNNILRSIHEKNQWCYFGLFALNRTSVLWTTSLMSMFTRGWWFP